MWLGGSERDGNDRLRGITSGKKVELQWVNERLRNPAL